MATNNTESRVPFPEETAADILFKSNRTCCVCRVPRLPVQIHHVDGDHSNSIEANGACVCLTCHDDTQVRGGFGRKLDEATVLRYRDDWYAQVAAARSTLSLPKTEAEELGLDIPERVRTHDAAIFEQLRGILPEQHFREFLDRLVGDHSYQGNVLDAVLDYRDKLSVPECEFLSTAISARADSLRIALDATVDFLGHHFFHHPAASSQQDRYCLYPELNIDRGGRYTQAGIQRYTSCQRELGTLVSATSDALIAFRRAIKRTLFL